LTEIEVAEAKGISEFVVNLRGSNDDWLQLQSASTPNPQKISLSAVFGFYCTAMISFASILHAASESLL
jgi:hypothetical protein